MELEHFSSFAEVDYSAGRPALLIGDDAAGLDEAREIIVGAGVRIGGVCDIAGALDRLDVQASTGLLWLECGIRWPGDSLIDRVGALADAGTPVVVSIGQGLIDAATAALPQSNVQFLVDADAIARAAALSVALADGHTSARVSDVGRDNAVRLRQLSDEVGRIAASLARLSAAPAESPRVLVEHDFGKAGEVDIEHVRAVIRARRLRERFFEPELFADPAWDMLLDLLQAEIAQHRVPVSSLCIAAAVPATTALRWIKTMTDSGLFVRRADPHDRRRIFVELAPAASNAMRAYFSEAGLGAGL